MTRRNRVRQLSLVVFTALLLVPGAARARGHRNVILMIGDGFGPQHFGATWLYSDRVLGRELCMVEVMQRGHTGYVVNDTADAIVTESAAAASQMATGQRAIARVLSVAPDGTPYKTVLEIAQESGMATGLVTTSGITDATPGAFAAHLLNRNWEDKVAEQELAHGVDVLMGGRKEFFLPRSVAGSKRTDERDLTAEAQAAGYTVVQDAEALSQVTHGKVLGLFSFGNMAYELDRQGTTQPSLAAMTTKALRLLSRGHRGFFAMIEGGRIDHAAHRNDAAGVIRDALAFDEAVCVALEFQRRNPDTLLLITSDHETGGMALIGHSKESPATGNYVGIDLDAISRAKVSLESLFQQLGTPSSPAVIQDGVREALGIEITDAEAQLVFDDVMRSLDPANYSQARYVHTLAFVLRPYLRVAFSTGTHTASPLFAYGVGPGSPWLVGFHHNTELFGIIRAAMLHR